MSAGAAPLQLSVHQCEENPPGPASSVFSYCLRQDESNPPGNAELFHLAEAEQPAMDND